MPPTFPESSVPDPRVAPSVRWGIVGTGWIAAQFTEALRKHTNQKVVAVGSRTAARAAQFAQRHGIEYHFPSYAALCGCAQVDAVYVAVPQSEHRDTALLAIDAGKAVLVEKPFTTTSAQARDIADAATRHGVFVMEAMWTRYLPHSDVIRRILREDMLGEVRSVVADHGQAIPPDSRLFRPEAGGGALLDLGVYPFAFASEVLGAPLTVHTNGTVTETGVDASQQPCCGTRTRQHRQR